MHTPLLETKVQQKGKFYLIFFFYKPQSVTRVTRLSITEDEQLAALLCSFVLSVLLMDVQGLS